MYVYLLVMFFETAGSSKNITCPPCHIDLVTICITEHPTLIDNIDGYIVTIIIRSGFCFANNIASYNYSTFIMCLMVIIIVTIV